MKLSELGNNESRIIPGKGIIHIDDHSICPTKLLEILKNISQFEITEKVDGSALWFGLDPAGKFFTSRDNKEGGIYYHQNDWGTEFKDTPFKSAHIAIENRIDALQESGLLPGDIVEAEILFGEKPNAIPYHSNQIIFLRPIQGEANIDKLSESLFGITSKSILFDVPYTEDGKIINRRDETHVWTFSKAKKYDFDPHIFEKLVDHVETLEKFLHSPNNHNFKVINEGGEDKILSNFEILSLRTTKHNKFIKESIKDVIDGTVDIESGKRLGKTGIRYEIKEVLLNELVRFAESSLGPSKDQGGWIEGVVLRRPGTGKNGSDEQIKIVDKEIFTSVNKFNYQMREVLTSKHKSIDASKEKAGILGNLLREMARCINHPHLGTIQSKRYIKTLGNSFEERIESITKGIQLEDTKKDWIKLLERTRKVTKSVLEQYKDQYPHKEYVDLIGRVHKYDSVINNRTLQTFATLFDNINSWKNLINESNNTKELIMILIKDKI